MCLLAVVVVGAESRLLDLGGGMGRSEVWDSLFEKAALSLYVVSSLFSRPLPEPLSMLWRCASRSRGWIGLWRLDDPLSMLWR